MFQVQNIQPINSIESQNITPLFQDWSPVSNTIVQRVFGNPEPSPFNIVFKVKDVVNNPNYFQYSAFRLVGGPHNYVNLFPNVPFLNIAWPSGFPHLSLDPVPITTNDVSFTFPVVFMNLFAIGEGVCTFRFLFVIQGLNGSEWENISTYTHDLILQTSQSVIQFNPKHLYFNHIIGDSLPSQTITVQGGFWRVIVPPGLSIGSNDPEVFISFLDGRAFEASGFGLSGPRELIISLEALHNDVANINLFNELIAFVTFSGQIFGNIPIKIDKSIDANLVVTPNVLNFEAVKGVLDAEPQSFTYKFPSVPNITAPLWLNVQFENQLINNFTVPGFIVTPLSSANMSPGNYQGQIIVSGTHNSVSYQQVILVNYQIIDYVSLPNNGNLIYTLEPWFHWFSSNIPNTFYQLNIKAQITDRQSFQTIEKNTTVKIGLFNQIAKFYMGSLIHQMFQRLNPITSTINQYNAAEVSMLMQEIDLNTKEVIREFLPLSQKYLPGISNPFGLGFLSLQRESKRAYQNQQIFLNIYNPSKQTFVNVFKNGTQINTLSIIGATDVVSFPNTLSFAKPGDVIEYQFQGIMSDSDNVSKTKFIIFPDPLYDVHIIEWEDVFLLRDVLHFSGVIIIETSFDVKKYNTFNQVVNELQKQKISNETKIKINTGFILKNDIIRVKDLMQSQNVWINNSGQRIKLTPISEKIVEENTLMSTVDFEIEFILNKEFDEKNYSF